MNRSALFTVLVFLLLVPASLVTAQDRTMIGRQSQNEGMLVVPAPGAVAIDGKLDDWDQSGRIWMFADKDVRSRYSGQIAAMWSADALYLAFRWFDPTPMVSNINPLTDPREGWRSDSVQMRVRTADQVSWLTTWYYTPNTQPVMDVTVWKDMKNSREGTQSTLLLAEPGQTSLGQGVEMAYRATEDRTGFVQEIKIPWKVLFKSPPQVAAGMTLQIGFEMLWGDPTGKLFPIHRYADNLQKGQTQREFFWTARDSWGDLKLVEKGGVPERQYVNKEDRIDGTVPVRVAVPSDAVRATIAINDERGKRVRNLAGDLTIEDYTVAVNGNQRTIEVKWDLLDDGGAMVSSGKYQAIGLSQKGLGAEYEMCFYNPGTPPWETQDGTGSWGADHAPPLRVARTGDSIAVSWAFAEGGSGIIVVGADGKKKWGEKRGGHLLAGDDRYVYAVPAGWHIKQPMLIRLGRGKGEYRSFIKDGKDRPFELPLNEIVGEDGWKAVSLAVNEKHIVLLLRKAAVDAKAASHGDEADDEDSGTTEGSSRLVWLDKESAIITRSITLPTLRNVALGGDGVLFATDAKSLYRLSAQDAKLTPILAATLAQPGALTIDNQGNTVVIDLGPDQQVKAFKPDGTLAYTCGRKGGRSIRGPFDEQAMSHMSSVAVDAKGQVWVVENWDYPRRVSVWNPADGKLVRDYIGNTGYAGTGSWLHDQNPELAHVGPVEMRLDKASRTWKVTNILWVPDKSKGEGFEIQTGDHVLQQRFTAVINGKSQEYFLNSPYRDYNGYVIYMPRNNRWQPVSAVTTVGRVAGAFTSKGVATAITSGEFADCNAYDGLFWNDTNRDGILQRSECEIVKTNKPGTEKRRGEFGIPLGSGWGQRMSPDLSFYVNGVYRYTPLSFTDDGAPIYGSKSLSAKLFDERGDLIPVPEEGLVLALGTKGYPMSTRISGFDVSTGQQKWSYPNPFPGVHGSHRATMPAPGLVIGPLKICGVAHVNDQVGRVFLMRGNLGQDFIMTTDGLYVGAMFQDGRLPTENLPQRESDLVGRPMEVYSHGGEPFNGWFGKQSDGVIRMTTGFPRQAAMILSVKGLDTIRRIVPVSVDLGPSQLAQADKDNIARRARTAEAKKLVVAQFNKPPTIDGGAADWEPVTPVTIDRAGFPFKGLARLGYDASNLYLLYEIEDPSPWKNGGKDYTNVFKSGDAVDLQMSVEPEPAGTARRAVGASDMRLVIGQVSGKPTMILMKPIDPSANAQASVKYQSPVGVKSFDRVEVLKDATVKVRVSDNGYVVEASVPLATIGLKPAKGLTLRGDVGFISSDAQGTFNAARTYWSNKDTNLVNDLPLEAWLTPEAWGTLVFD